MEVSTYRQNKEEKSSNVLEKLIKFEIISKQNSERELSSFICPFFMKMYVDCDLAHTI